MRRILWLATADARGHLMRCQLLARALGARGVAVDVVTTSDEGRAFLGAFGLAADVLSPHYRVEFDDRQNMARLRTEWRVVRYVAAPARLRRDLAWLGARARGVDLIVNDSFHPALLLARSFAAGRALPPIAHVYGQELRGALEGNFAGRLPRAFARAYGRFIARRVDGAFARIEHAIDAPADGRLSAPRTWRLPPAIALPARAAGDVRARLGVGPEQRLVVVYLNPHFRAPAVAAAVEAAFPAPAFALHAVGEGYASRPGWYAHDRHLSDAIGAACLFVSAPGMGALGQARVLGVPFIAVVTDQPEQVANLARLRADGYPWLVAVSGAGAALDARLAAAARRLLAAAGAGSRAGAAVRGELAAAVAGDARGAFADAVPIWARVLSELAEEASAAARVVESPNRRAPDEARRSAPMSKEEAA